MLLPPLQSYSFRQRMVSSFFSGIIGTVRLEPIPYLLPHPSSYPCCTCGRSEYSLVLYRCRPRSPPNWVTEAQTAGLDLFSSRIDGEGLQVDGAVRALPLTCRLGSNSTIGDFLCTSSDPANQRQIERRNEVIQSTG